MNETLRPAGGRVIRHPPAQPGRRTQQIGPIKRAERRPPAAGRSLRRAAAPIGMEGGGRSAPRERPRGAVDGWHLVRRLRGPACPNRRAGTASQTGRTTLDPPSAMDGAVQAELSRRNCPDGAVQTELSRRSCPDGTVQTELVSGGVREGNGQGIGKWGHIADRKHVPTLNQCDAAVRLHDEHYVCRMLKL